MQITFDLDVRTFRKLVTTLIKGLSEIGLRATTSQALRLAQGILEAFKGEKKSSAEAQAEFVGTWGGFRIGNLIIQVHEIDDEGDQP